MKIEEHIIANNILRNVQEKFQNQQVKGLAKYGETVKPASYDIVGWLNHLQQELIDGTVYTEVLINEISKIVGENKRLREALMFYADTENYTYRFKDGGFADPLIVGQDFGKIARQALKVEESK